MPKAIGKNVLLKIQVSNKEKYNLTEDIQIEISRGFEFNRRIDYPSYGIVIDAKKIPAGAEVLVHHNATEKTYEIENCDLISAMEKSEGWKVFTIDPDMCFVYRTGEEWLPCEDYLITTRIFKPYTGTLEGVPNEQVSRRLYVIKGSDTWDGKETDLSGKVLCVTDNSDYEIIFHNKQHRQESIIRTRHRELLCVDNGMLQQIKKNELYLGLNPDDCKPLKEFLDGEKHIQTKQLIIS